MRSASLRFWAIGAAILAGSQAVPGWGQQDTWTGVERVVAVGDVHGDHARFVKVLQASGVIDANENWIAGKAHLVQMGDVLDRGPDSRKVMDLLMKLESQASRAGGAVHALIGNHEAMVLLDDWRYVHEGEVEAFGGETEFRQAMSPKGKYGRWIRSHNAVVKINDLLFVHGGIAPWLARKSLAEINKSIRDELDRSDANGLAMDSAGPLWDRSLVMDDDRLVAKDLDEVLRAYGAARMIVGHTVSIEGIRPRAGGRLIQIDVGLSGLYGGPASCLVAEKGVLYEVRHGAGTRRLPLGAASQPATQPVSRPAAKDASTEAIGALGHARAGQPAPLFACPVFRAQAQARTAHGPA